MAKIKTSSVEEVRARADLYDVISVYVPSLKRSGSYYRGLSPFKDEKTPSFYVYPEKGFYYCFSTSQGGDVFKFVQIKENMNFPEAVEFLAKKYSIDLKYDDDGRNVPASKRKQLFDLHEICADWYSRQFFADTPQAKEIRNYWVSERGFTLEEAKELRIGFAPENSDELKKIVAEKKFAPNVVGESGLFYARNGELNARFFNPRFRGRMMIPICDIQGRVIAFTARKTRFTPDLPSEAGKYVNSCDTDIFNKKFVVFNLDRAKNFIGEKNYSIVVEGQLDTIRMFCSGFKNTVATQGTAAGLAHFKLLRRYAGKIVLMFDGDAAGRHAALRVIPICFEAGLEPFVAVIPDNDDPDSFIRKRGVEAMKELVENGKKTALSFAANALLSDNPAPTPQDRYDASVELFKIIDVCPSQVLRDDYTIEAANALAVDYTSFKNDFKNWKRSQKSKQTSVGDDYDAPFPAEENAKPAILTNSIQDALIIALHYENVAEGFSQIIDDSWILSEAAESRALVKLLALYREGIGFSIDKTDDFFDAEDEKNLIYKSSTAENSLFENPVKAANECIAKIYKNFCLSELESLNTELKKADTSERKFAIIRKIAQLRRDMKRPPARIETE